MNWTWNHLSMVHLLWPAIAFVAFVAYRQFSNQQDFGRFVSIAMQRRLALRVSPGRKIARVVCIAGALVAGILALMQPQAPGTATQIRTARVSADIVVALDVSRSMLAEDAAPNRLARAKAEVSRMLDHLAGHRISLVAFAGAATVLTPLTTDYGFFRMMLRGTSTTSVSRGGTAIGEAIRTGLRAFDEDGGAASRLLVLITDGEDHDSYPEDAAKEAKEAGVRIVAIGLGSEEGTQIKITDPETGVPTVVVDRDGNPVVTRVDGALLRTISELTDGVYVPAKVSALNLQEIVDEHIEPMVEEATISASRVIPDERYPILVLVSLLCLVLAVLLQIAPKPETAKGNHHV